MPPSLESQDKVGSLSADNNNRDCLFSSPAAHPLGHEQPDPTGNNPANDDVMDFFLNQVAEYNAQQLSFDDKLADPHNPQVLDPSYLLAVQEQTQQRPKLETASRDFSQLTMNDAQPFIDFTDPKVSPSASSSTPSVPARQSSANGGNAAAKKNGKAKSKDSTSLLQVFTNPLLHAIPILARNCLNFEDFLAQTAVPGQNVLLGPKDGDSGNDDYGTADRLILDPSKERSVMNKYESQFHIRVLGLPPSGAKSRVETQIKICLQLAHTSSGELATNWSHLKLPEHMVAKEKLKRKNTKYGTEEKPALTDSEVLILDAAVVCDSHADNEIIMCTSCVHRERKRLKRKRDNKVARAANKEGGAAKVAALFANDLPDLEDEAVMAEERRKILLFNCTEYVEFNGGEATLPTRVTCYCRHHSEKVGFRIVFTLKNHHHQVIATGRSPPIMITDDHKSSKVQTTGKKRSRAEVEGSPVEMEPPVNTKRKASTMLMCNADGETDSGVSSPVASTPATPTSQGEDGAHEQSPLPTKLEVTSTATTTFDETMDPSSSQGVGLEKHPSSSKNLLSHLGQQAQDAVTFTQQLQQDCLFGSLNLNDLNMEQLMANASMIPTSLSPTTLPQPQRQQEQQQQQQNQQNSLATLQQQQQQILSHFNQNPMQTALYRRRFGGSGLGAQQSWQNNQNIYAKIQQQQQRQQQAAADERKPTNLPRLHRLIPSEGPIYGGAEVTVLGSNFYEGLTCLFGENPAVPTHCWSANTLLCILPPAATAGPVVVSFKEHPLMLEGQDVVLFTYFDESDRALMELALQVVGLKTMGKVEDARQIAMRIVQGDSGGNSGQGERKGQGGTTSFGRAGLQLDYREMLTIQAASAAYYNARTLCLPRLEEKIIAALVAVTVMPTRYRCDLTLTNRNHHTLLHLATICGYARLVKALIKLGCDVNKADNNGFTALHFASWTGKLELVKILIGKSNLEIRNHVGKTAERLAVEAGHQSVVDVFRKRRVLRPRPVTETAVRIPLTDFIPSSAVKSVTSVLPARLTNMLSSLYTLSTNEPRVQKFTHSVGQIYNFMLDPF
ncbi:uncharacterized protein BYT42DRAFT_517234 [Radiomyces spectabilis]|uniref:uncharacterized protein n=1 Tax=Radiomyces spectabilis TaxID=64574 RepID=UPI00221F5101|nr:uncharacterized protein BYT42DRAFT_517234 [Radiomyces spectabilis]KAI8376339.1 hypothetical protein BYT42DRAFT_517234 [Radiomyces spectabilis]